MHKPIKHSVLEHRPKLLSLRVDELLREVRKGRIRIPHFQRPLKWKSEDVLLLFDSIIKGYPVGTLLFWERAAQNEMVDFGPVRIEAGPNNQAWFIVDGQQRVAAIVGGLLHSEWKPRTTPDDFVVFYDAEHGRFLRPDRKATATPPSWVPVQKLGDTRALLSWLDEFRKHKPPEEQVDAVMAAAASLQDYQLQVAVVASDEDRPLREIFKRFNTAGRSMEDTDVFNALHGGNAAGGGLRTLTALGAEVQKLGFGSIDEEWLLHAAMAANGVDITRNVKPALEDPAIAQSLPRVRDAIQATVSFLQQHAAIPHVTLLRYKLSFVALVKFFSQHPTPHQTTFHRLRRWLWRSILSGALSGDSRPGIRAVLGAIQDDEQASVAGLMQTVPHVSADEIRTLLWHQRPEKLDWRSAGTAARLAALVQLRPADWGSGQPIPLAEIVQRIEARDLARLAPAGVPDAG